MEIEAVINCRSLCYMYSDEIDEALTPSHMITGKLLLSPRCYIPAEISQESERTMNKSEISELINLTLRNQMEEGILNGTKGVS